MTRKPTNKPSRAVKRRATVNKKTTPLRGRSVMLAAIKTLFDGNKKAGGYQLYRRFYVSTCGGNVWAYGDTMEEALSCLDRELPRAGQRARVGKVPTTCVLFLAAVPFDSLESGSSAQAAAKGLAWAGGLSRLVNCWAYYLW